MKTAYQILGDILRGSKTDRLGNKCRRSYYKKTRLVVQGKIQLGRRIRDYRVSTSAVCGVPSYRRNFPGNNLPGLSVGLTDGNSALIQLARLGCEHNQASFGPLLRSSTEVCLVSLPSKLLRQPGMNSGGISYKGTHLCDKRRCAIWNVVR